MASRLQVLRHDDFTGGLNLRADQFQLAQNESPKMLNVEIDPRGGLFSRGAMRRVNTAPITANWTPEVLFPFYGSNHYVMLSTSIVGMMGGGVYYSTGGDFTATSFITTAEFGSQFAPWGSTLFITRGRSVPGVTWSGPGTETTMGDASSAWQNNYQSPSATKTFPCSDLCVTHAGKVFVASTTESGTTYRNRIRWSHPNNPYNWAANDYIDINDGGSDITAIAVYNGQLLVFKQNAMFAILGYDSDTFQVVEISRSVGALSPRAVVATEHGVYFFSYPDGLMMYDGQRIVDVFEPIRPSIVMGHVNTNAIQQVRVNYLHKRIWVSMPYSTDETVSYLSTSFVLDPTIGRRGAWLMHRTADGRGIAAGTTFVGTSGGLSHLVAHPSVADVLSVDLYSQSSDLINGIERPYDSRYRTRWHDAGMYSQKKMFRRPDIIAKQASVPTSIDVEVYRDYEEAEGTEFKEFSIPLPLVTNAMIWGTSTWSSATWGAASVGAQVVNGNNIGLARSVQLEFRGPQGLSWGLNSYTLKYVPRRIKA